MKNETSQDEQIKTEDKAPLNKEEIKTTPQAGEEKATAPMRRILIETDGNQIKLVENQTAGVLELSSILSTLLNALQKGQQ